MKKYLLGLVAVVIAVGLSAFTSEKSIKESDSNLTPYYWFLVQPGDGDLQVLNNGNIAEYMGYSVSPPSAGCTGSGFNCVVGFDEDDVNIEEEKLKTGDHSIDSPGISRSQE